MIKKSPCVKKKQQQQTTFILCLIQVMAEIRLNRVDWFECVAISRLMIVDRDQLIERQK